MVEEETKSWSIYCVKIKWTLWETKNIFIRIEFSYPRITLLYFLLFSVFDVRKKHSFLIIQNLPSHKWPNTLNFQMYFAVFELIIFFYFQCSHGSCTVGFSNQFSSSHFILDIFTKNYSCLVIFQKYSLMHSGINYIFKKKLISNVINISRSTFTLIFILSVSYSSLILSCRKRYI